ncbi:MAG: hypothetical protein R2854_05075 [Caldilineaceae bacterium]
MAAGERWYARVDYVDAVGNTAGAVLGPLFVGRIGAQRDDVGSFRASLQTNIIAAWVTILLPA